MKGVTKFERLCHALYDAAHPFVLTDRPCSRCGSDLSLYYCESRLYLVECRKCGIKTLLKARNPEEACRIVSEGWNGTYCDLVNCTNSPPGGSFCESGTCHEREEWDRIKLPDQLRETVKEEDYGED